MPGFDEARDDLVAALLASFGVPAQRLGAAPRELTGFERLAWVMLGLVATPGKATAAFNALRDAELLDAARLAAVNPLEIDDIFKQDRIAMALRSLRPLQKLARWVSEQVDDPEHPGLTSKSTATIRDEWRSINGVGLATADALLLFGLRRPSYPVDRATYRVLVRHGWLDLDADYDQARELVEKFAATDPQIDHGHNLDEVAAVVLLENFSYWFERVGREFCKPSRAHCDRCPLHPWLPSSGPVEVE